MMGRGRGEVGRAHARTNTPGGSWMEGGAHAHNAARFSHTLTWWYQEDVICWANLPVAIVQWVGAHLKVTGTWNKKRHPNLPVSYPGVGST